MGHVYHIAFLEKGEKDTILTKVRVAKGFRFFTWVGEVLPDQHVLPFLMSTPP